MQNLRFKVSAGLKSIIGRDLITNDFVAIFELVKNAFDARATHVRIVFDLETKESSAIYIADDGKGMSEADIREKWLFVAYSAKKNGEEDAGSGHVYAGSKGIGRFSCDRLGQHLRLQSKIASLPLVSTVDVNWGDFEEKPKTEFSTITVQFDQHRGFSASEEIRLSCAEHGTVLQITHLREYESWTRDKLLKLKRSLQKLLDPFAGAVIPRDIELVCSREVVKDQATEIPEKRINGLIRNNVFGQLLNASTVIQSELDTNTIETVLIDRGEKIYRIAESVKDTRPELSSFKIKCEIAYLNTASKRAFHRIMGIESVRYGSVFLVHNGFRVYPVGEETDDFWGLNRRKQQGYNRYLGTREVLGCVRIEDANNIFQEASNREGLVHSPAVEVLQEFVLDTVKRLEAYITRVTWKDPSDRDNLTPDSLSKDETRSRIIKLIKDMATTRRVRILEYNHNLIDILNSKSATYEESLFDLRFLAEGTKDPALLNKIDFAEKRFRELQARLYEQQLIVQGEQNARQAAEKDATLAREEARKQRLAYDEEKKRNILLISEHSRGAEYYECFIHTIANDLKTARMSMEDILTDYRSIYSCSPEFADGLFDLMEQIEHLQSLSRFAISGNFRFDAENVDGDLVQFFKVYVARVAKTSHHFINISFSSSLDKAMATFSPTGMGVVIDNLITNAKKADAISISFKLVDRKSSWVIEVLDDGKGISPFVDIERLFEKGYSRTDGSGLGLYFCKKMLEEINGKISVVQNANNQGLCFIIEVPKL